jgi:hypothetical protein
VVSNESGTEVHMAFALHDDQVPRG